MTLVFGPTWVVVCVTSGVLGYIIGTVMDCARQSKRTGELKSALTGTLALLSGGAPSDAPSDAQASKNAAPEYNTMSDITQVFARDDVKMSGDDQLLQKIHDVGQRSREAIAHRARMTSDNFRQYFDEELYEQENRHWWGNVEQESA